MDDRTLGAVESRFADIIWAHEPLFSGELVRLCGRELQWKKSTTYTVLKKLIERGIMRNDGGTVTACLTRDEFYARQSERFVDESFGGSLPAFLAAFTSRKELSAEEVAEIRAMIDGHTTPSTRAVRCASSPASTTDALRSISTATVNGRSCRSTTIGARGFSGRGTAKFTVPT